MNKAKKVCACDSLVLALDLGTASVGWAVLKKNADGIGFSGLIDMGSRIFESGMDINSATGKGESHALARREARQSRRMTDRRKRRKQKLFNAIQKAGLFPDGKTDDVIKALDKQILQSRLGPKPDPVIQRQLSNTLPYALRAEALDNKLCKHELGRALLSLGMRRGYLSNRRSGKASDDGAVAKGISSLLDEIERADCRTIGEYFSKIDPHTKRIRQRYTHRSMFIKEFEMIWSAQQSHYPEILTKTLRKKLYDAIFYQRPLKPSDHLIGRCSLEPDRRRCSMDRPLAQRFRLLQQINNCKVIDPYGVEREFTDQERTALIEALENTGDITFHKAKTKFLKEFGFNKNYHFSLEAGGETRFIGNRIKSKIVEVFGDKWPSLNSDQQMQVIEDVRSITKPETLEVKAQNKWGLDKIQAKELADLDLESGYSNLSASAIVKLLPLMETGVHYMTAVKQVYGEATFKPELCDTLPAVLDKMPDLRNPLVTRTLTELRKVVNAVIKKYGKPGMIRIELARDMKQTEKQRKNIIQRNSDQRKRREKARAEIIASRDVHIQSPSRNDILKILLAEECDWKCPYTGKSICMTSLLGQNPQFDIEHIIPFSKSLDDSFLNKTLCYCEDNRNVKRNMTPFQAYGGNAERWDEIIARVKKFAGDARSEKLRRFLDESEPDIEDFASNQLNDTRYASKLAMQYLSFLYGGLWDEAGVRRVQATRGGVTKYIRDMYGLNRILDDGGEKTRSDHRHHAVDAVAIGLSTPAMIKQLSEVAVRQYERGQLRARFRQLGEPWEGFEHDVRDAVSQTKVSHRVNHRLSGALHKETNYGPVRRPDGQLEFHVRKRLEDMSVDQVKNIVDDRVRELVQEKLSASGKDPQKTFTDPANTPYLTTRDGGKIPIHKARICVSDNPKNIKNKKGVAKRFVTAKSNHHLEIVAVLDKDGNEKKWEGHIVSLLEANLRKKEGREIVQRDHGQDRVFKFSIAPGDTLKLGNPGDKPELVVVRSVSTTKTGIINVEFVSIYEARKVADIKKAKPKQWHSSVPNKLLKEKAQKVIISVLGEVIVAND